MLCQRVRCRFLLARRSRAGKISKAVLKLNGRSGKAGDVGRKQVNYGHDIIRLYADAKPLAPELLPTMLTCPSKIEDPHWHDLTPERFVQRLYNMGHADNRYQLTGYVLRSRLEETMGGKRGEEARGTSP